MTTEDSEITTEEAVTDRGINTLLNLTTYEGLTDGEVRKLMNYSRLQAQSDALITASRATAQTMMETVQECMAAVCEDSNNVLESITSMATNYQSVAPVAATNFLSSLDEV